MLGGQGLSAAPLPWDGSVQTRGRYTCDTKYMLQYWYYMAGVIRRGSGGRDFLLHPYRGMARYRLGANEHDTK